MAGRDFLLVARDLAAGPTPYHQRAAVVNAYFALLLECRDALERWGRQPPRNDSLHAWVRLRLTYAGDQDLKSLGYTLDKLVQDCNQASYNLRPFPAFSSPASALDKIQKATNSLVLLDAIEADPARRATAIASLPP